MNRSLAKKKMSGEFYTPPFIVDLMIERIFHYLILEKKIQKNSFRGFSESLLKLSFLDPAVGSGNFVLGLLRFIWNELRNYSTSIGEKKELLRNFYKNNVHSIDINKSALELCKKRILSEFSFFRESDVINLHLGNSLVNSDVYDYFPDNVADKLLPFSWEEKFSQRKKFDVIIGNPPYFNLKKMGLMHSTVKILFDYLKQSNGWKEVFRSSSDIYYYFIFLALRKLKSEGVFSYIIPNYWIDNTYADLLREKLQSVQILDIVDFDRVKIFKEEGRWLNISTCILTVQNTSPSQNMLIFKNIPRNFFQFKKRSFVSLSSYSYPYSQNALKKEKWSLSPYISKIRKILKNNNFVPLSSKASISQGLSPGAKKIFVMTKEKSETKGIEGEVLVPFLSNRDIQKWIINQQEELVAILPSRIRNLGDFPQTKLYLEKHKKKLSTGPDRRRLISSEKIRWFDYSVYRNLAVFERKENKILCPYRSKQARFGYDNSNFFGATDIYAITEKEPENLFIILAILNSTSFDFWYRECGKKKGNMLEFFSKPLQRTLIPVIKEKTDLRNKVTNLLKMYERNRKSEEITILEKEIDSHIAEAYGLETTFLMKYQKSHK